VPAAKTAMILLHRTQTFSLSPSNTASKTRLSADMASSQRAPLSPPLRNAKEPRFRNEK
jgi:hypothetical protein